MTCYAVLGMGSIAKRHISNLRLLHPDSKIYSLSASGRNMDIPLGADAIISFEELLLQRPEYVIVASPAPYHIDAAKILLSNNIKVLIEKPLAHNFDSCNALIDVLPEKLINNASVAYCLRFLPSASVVKNFLDACILGHVYNVNVNVGQFLPTWRADKSYKDSVSVRKELGGGVLLELSHELDYLLWFFGDLELKYSWLRTTEELGLEVEEISDLTMLTSSGTYISLHLDFIQKSKRRLCEFIGENGRLVWDLIENSVIFYHSEGVDELYSEPEYNKNLMYIDMLIEFENKERKTPSLLASVYSSAKVVRLIDKAKVLNKWRAQD